MRNVFIIAALFMFTGMIIQADEMRPAYLELQQIDADAYDVIWKVPARGPEQRSRGV